MDIAPDTNLLAVGCRTGEVDVVAVPEFKLVTRISLPFERFYGGSLSRDGAEFYGVFGSENWLQRNSKAELICWSVHHQRIENRQNIPGDARVASVCVSPSRHQLAIATTNAVHLAELSSRSTLKGFVKKQGTLIDQLVYVSDRILLIADEWYGMQLVDTNCKKVIRTFVATRDGCTCFCTNGNVLVRATAYRNEIELFTLPTGRLKKYFTGHLQSVSGLAISGQQENTLLSAGNDGALKLWDLSSGRLRASVVVETRHKTGCDHERDADVDSRDVELFGVIRHGPD